MSEFKAQDLVCTAWALATVNRSELTLFAALAAEAVCKLINIQDLVNTAWAFATVNHRDEQMFSAMTKTATRQLSEFNAQDLSNTA